MAAVNWLANVSLSIALAHSFSSFKLAQLAGFPVRNTESMSRQTGRSLVESKYGPTFQGDDFTRCSRASSVTEKEPFAFSSNSIAVKSVSITSVGRSRRSKERQMVCRSQ